MFISPRLGPYSYIHTYTIYIYMLNIRPRATYILRNWWLKKLSEWEYMQTSLYSFISVIRLSSVVDRNGNNSKRYAWWRGYGQPRLRRSVDTSISPPSGRRRWWQPQSRRNNNLQAVYIYIYIHIYMLYCKGLRPDRRGKLEAVRVVSWTILWRIPKYFTKPCKEGRSVEIVQVLENLQNLFG